MSPALPELLVGFGAGAVVMAGAAAWIIRRHLRRVRAAVRRARAAERAAEIGAMTGGLAHEIKNPLSTIGLNAQLLGEALDELPIEPDEKGRLSRRLAALRREVERLRGILTDFLQFAGEVRVEPRPADLNQLVEELADFFLAQAESQGVRLRTELAPGPVMALMDVAQVKQALLNLMLNAVQAMAEAARGSPGDAGAPRELILRTARAADQDKRRIVELHVIDTGPGIDPAQLPRLFQPYFTTKSGGTGLGLPTARRLIEAHDGRIDVHTEPGKGSDFVIVLPAP